MVNTTWSASPTSGARPPCTGPVTASSSGTIPDRRAAARATRPQATSPATPSASAPTATEWTMPTTGQPRFVASSRVRSTTSASALPSVPGHDPSTRNSATVRPSSSVRRASAAVGRSAAIGVGGPSCGSTSDGASITSVRLVRSAGSGSGDEHERRVVAAEPERVRQHRTGGHLAHVVADEVDRRVRRRDRSRLATGGTVPSAAQRSPITASTAPAAPTRCPVTPLVEVTGGPASPKTLVRASASAASLSGVDVPWALTCPIGRGLEAGVGEGLLHAGDRRGAVRVGRGDVARIAGGAVAGELAEDGGPALDGVVPALEHEEPGALAHHEPVAVAVERARRRGRVVVASSSSAPMRPNAAIAVGVMLASAPPASATSARPARISSAASPMLLAPDAHAVATQRLGPWNP